MAQTQILMTLSEIEFVSRNRNAATRCVLRAYNAAKCDCRRGSAPDPAGGAFSGGEWRGREGRVRGGKEGNRRRGAGKKGKGKGG